MKTWYSCQGTIIGNRESNDDVINISFWKVWRCYHLLTLCDGIGGLQGSGECAEKVVAISEKIAKTFIAQRRTKNPFKDNECLAFADYLTQGFSVLNGCPNQGTTFTLAMFSYHSALIAWAGDSRIYALMDDGTLHQLTDDHQNSQGKITQFVRGDGIVIGGLEVRQFSMDNIIAIIGISDGIYEACSTEELRRFTLYCMKKRLTDSKLLDVALLHFLKENIFDNATFGIIYKTVSIPFLNKYEWTALKT